RECLQDVYDLPALTELMGQIGRRRIEVREVETPAPSPFARSLLFGYLAQFIYDADAPLAERRTAALALDQSLLAELLGSVSLRVLMDAQVITEVEQRLQGLSAERALRGAEQIADALRRLGPLTRDQLSARSSDGLDLEAELEQLHRARRIIAVRLAGTEHLAAVEDAGLLRDALGTALPPGIPDAHLGLVDRAVPQLLARWARSRGPFPAEAPVEAFGLAPGVARAALEQLTAERILAPGEFPPGREGEEWAEAGVPGPLPGRGTGGGLRPGPRGGAGRPRAAHRRTDPGPGRVHTGPRGRGVGGGRGAAAHPSGEPRRLPP